MKTPRRPRAAVAAFLLLAFAGLTHGAAPVTPPAPPPAARPVQAPLETVRRALQQASSTLGTTTAAPIGIFSDRAQTDLARALDDVKAALTHAQAHPTIGDQPATVPPGLEQIRTRLNFTRLGNANAQTNPYYSALPFLKIALAALQATPGGDLGGFRDKIAAGIGQTATDIIGGIQYVESASGPASSPVRGGNVVRFATPANEAADAERAPPTAQARLTALQDLLKVARDTLRAAPAGSPGQTEAAAQLERALTAVADGLAYVNAHPGENPLPTEPLPVGLPGLGQRAPATAATATQLGISVQNLYAVYPAVFPVLDVLASGLFTFVNGTPLSTGSRGPVLGALGGHRDRIIFSVGLVGAALQAGATKLMPASVADPTDFPAATTGPTGALTGLVVDTAGEPAPNVLISYAPIPASATPVYQPGSYPGEIPAAITDELGVFNIPALPPGDYVVTAILISARGNWRLTGTLQSVGVNAGETTKLPAPFSPPLKLK